MYVNDEYKKNVQIIIDTTTVILRATNMPILQQLLRNVTSLMDKCVFIDNELDRKVADLNSIDRIINDETQDAGAKIALIGEITDRDKIPF